LKNKTTMKKFIKKAIDLLVPAIVPVLINIVIDELEALKKKVEKKRNDSED